MTMTALLENQTSDTAGTAAKKVSELWAFDSGRFRKEHITVHCSGTFNGVTVKLQIAPTASGPCLDNTDATFTAEGIQVSPISDNAYVRAVVSGTGSPAPDVSLYVG